MVHLNFTYLDTQIRVVQHCFHHLSCEDVNQSVIIEHDVPESLTKIPGITEQKRDVFRQPQGGYQRQFFPP